MLTCLAALVAAPPRGLRLSGGQDPLEKPITLKLAAAPLPKIVAALSKASGVPMATSMVVAKAVVILDACEQPLSQIMKRLAGAIGGSWKHEKDLYRLIRDASDQRRMEAAERAHRADQIAAELATSKEIR